MHREFRFLTGRDTLEPFLAGITAMFAEQGLAPALLHDISLALAEVINNITRHGYANQPGREVLLQVTVSGSTITMLISDDGPEFNPLTAPRRDLNALTEHGMGIHLVTSLMSSVTYQRLAGGRNQLTITRTF